MTIPDMVAAWDDEIQAELLDLEHQRTECGAAILEAEETFAAAKDVLTSVRKFYRDDPAHRADRALPTAIDRRIERLEMAARTAQGRIMLERNRLANLKITIADRVEALAFVGRRRSAEAA